MTAAERFARANDAELELCREAVRARDYAGARARLTDLHWFAHDDPRIHTEIHRLELDVARRTGDTRTARGRILPVLFAGVVARWERLAPRYYSEALIDASPEVTYRVITDFERYSEWNPWLTAVRGAPEPGASVAAQVVLNDNARHAMHEVTVVDPGRRFGWRDKGWVTALAGGNRLRVLLTEGDRTRLVVRLALTGPLAFLAHALFGTSLVRGLAAETAALAERAGAVAAGSVPA
ncbi:SRPBCC family protein [Nocardia sp. NPDC003693]